MRLDVLFAWAVFDTEVTEESNLFLFWPLKKKCERISDMERCATDSLAAADHERIREVWQILLVGSDLAFVEESLGDQLVLSLTEEASAVF